MKSISAVLILLSLHISIAQDDYEFPVEFLFGVATASYQVEGGWDAEGKGENIWDYMTHNFPDRIEGGSNGDIACDTYSKTDEDVELLDDLGVQFYRFSFSWSRILPTGHINNINPDGIAYYHDLINKLQDKGIAVVPTIYHWDLPQPLQELGGWMNPMMVEYFVRYADVLFREYSPRVQLWVTINEPAQVCSGYSVGGLAPAYTQTGVGDYLCGHHLLLAHARTYHLFQERYLTISPNTMIGMTINSRWNEAKDPDSAEDQAAADRRMQWTLGWFAHPIFSEDGDYPPVMRRIIDRFSLEEEHFTRTRLPIFTAEEIALIKGSADFFGLNHYTSALCRPLVDASSVLRPSTEYDTGATCVPDPDWPGAASPWIKVYPVGLRRLLNWIKDNYDDPKVFILENGFSDDGDFADDCGRISYYGDYLQEVLNAMIEDSCNVIGYTAWSFLDNFEWTKGYTEKFGLVQVDFVDDNRTRMPKPSFNFYKSIIENRRIGTHSCLEDSRN